VENVLLFRVDGGREGLDGAVDRDGRRAQRAELPDHVADGQAGAKTIIGGRAPGPRRTTVGFACTPSGLLSPPKVTREDDQCGGRFDVIGNSQFGGDE
jgi:hypothetical protein